MRCQPHRRSTGINIKPASNLHHAPRIAAAIGCPLGHFLTLNLQQMGVSPFNASSTMSELMQRYQKWVTRPRLSARWKATPAFYAWVLENDEVVGVHAHCMLHLPSGSEAEYIDKVISWLVRLTGTEPPLNAIHMEASPNPENRSYYLIKGGHPAVTAFFNRVHVPQGEIIGKRTGTSMNIGRTAKENLRREGRYRKAQRRFMPSLHAQG